MGLPVVVGSAVGVAVAIAVLALLFLRRGSRAPTRPMGRSAVHEGWLRGTPRDTVVDVTDREKKLPVVVYPTSVSHRSQQT